ncbi:hypothetical protein [Microbacterium amylolyticum]|uniref:Adhesin domain-containing protein n=1 Tax=Microbacterium amylolyticum TaxID=936337 RepID=A0ABS4ZJF2_9MICO|nr:hypothetical protein [Microbacterium amylolyticum]MBP2437138.1 hypothetical protein [Microbacterium amylolyticum]
MTDTTTPMPPAAPQPQPPQQDAPQSDTARVGSRALAIAVAVIGAIVLVFAGVGVAFTTVATSGPWTQSVSETGSVTAAGSVRSVDIEMSAGSLVVEYGDVDAATLDYASDRGAWRLERTGNGVLEVRSPNGRWNWWDWERAEAWATLTLPAANERVDLSADLGAGMLTLVGGTYGDVTVEMAAGWIGIDAAAASLNVDMAAGGGEIDLEDVRSATFEMAAGSLEVALTGTAPRDVDIDVVAGSFDLTLPDVPYNVRHESVAGTFDNGLTSSRGASNSIDVTVTAGSVSLSAE